MAKTCSDWRRALESETRSSTRGRVALHAMVVGERLRILKARGRRGLAGIASGSSGATALSALGSGTGRAFTYILHCGMLPCVPSLSTFLPMRFGRRWQAAPGALLRACLPAQAQGTSRELQPGSIGARTRLSSTGTCVPICGCSSMVEQQPSKLMTRVRFPSPAPSSL